MGRGRVLRRSVALIVALFSVTMASRASAQNLDSLRRQWALPGGGGTGLASMAAQSAPGNTFGSPSAFGADAGDVFVGASYQNRVRLSNTDEGAVVVGFGLGDSRGLAGLELAFTSYSALHRGLGNTGGVSLKVHRDLPDGFAAAFGYENAATWGSPDGGHSWYAVVSKIRNLHTDPNGFLGSLVLNAGIGNGRFRDFHYTQLSTGQIFSGTPLRSVGFFLSGGLRLHRTTSLIADWGGQDLSVGLSIAPFASLPLVLTPALADVTGRANTTARFVLGVGFGYHIPGSGQ